MRTPEEEHLQTQQERVARLAEEVARAEADLVATSARYESFRARYSREIAPLYAELDTLIVRIRELEHRLQPTKESERSFAEARAAAEESAEAADSVPSDESPPPREDLKPLFHRLAKLAHPDLADGEAERIRRTEVMARANQAYRKGDEDALRSILRNEEHRPEAITGEDLGSQLVRALRQIARLERRLAEIAAAQIAMADEALWALFRDAETQPDADLFGEIATSLRTQIDEARQRLEELRSVHAR